jgi:hypothetical protein
VTPLVSKHEKVGPLQPLILSPYNDEYVWMTYGFSGH